MAEYLYKTVEDDGAAREVDNRKMKLVTQRREKD